MAERLPEPAVPPEAYDSDYFLTACAGYAEWARSEGREFAGVYAGALHLAGLAGGETVVDVGTGRGELLVEAVRRGAAAAIGIEYAPDALALARETLDRAGVGESARVVQADARALPLDDASADLVTMLDVVEHLTREELDAALGEARRVLRPGGRVFVHTAPNRTVYRVTYRLQRALRPHRRRTWPADPRNEYEHLMHVGEQSGWSLRRALRHAGLRGVRVWAGRWVHADFVPDPGARALYARLAAHRPTRRLGGFDLFARGRAG